MVNMSACCSSPEAKKFKTGYDTLLVYSEPNKFG